MDFDIIATCAHGLERPLEDELRSLGAKELVSHDLAIGFKGNLEVAYRTCLWSRLANRVLLNLASFEAPDAESLYDGASAVDWHLHISPGRTMAVKAVAKGRSPYPAHYAALKVKDAIVDSIRKRHSCRPSIRTERPDVSVYLFLEKSRVILSIDLAGDALTKRGYRVRGAQAPLKETLAAGILTLAGWPAGDLLLDPMAGSGTFLAEAAMMAIDAAPGLERSYFGFLGWLGHNQTLWDYLVSEAVERKRQGLSKVKTPFLIGYDSSARACDDTRINMASAGLESLAVIEQRELAFLKPPTIGGNGPERPLLVVNPPYGERLENRLYAQLLGRCLAERLASHFQGWRAAVFMEEGLDIRSDTTSEISYYKLYNGPIPCRLKLFTVTTCRAPKKPPSKPSLSSAKGDEFADRLRKNARFLIPWASRERLDFYRIYDADIPQYNISVDVAGDEALLVEYRRPKGIDPASAEKRLSHCCSLVKEVLGLRKVELLLPRRVKEKSKAFPPDTLGNFREVREDGCLFLLDMRNPYYFGSFLVRRSLRRFMRINSEGFRLLHLYCRDGSETVCAALGGASGSFSVTDSAMNETWSRCNFAINGFSSENHIIKKETPALFIEAHKTPFDLILIQAGEKDPSADEILLHEALSRLSKGGKVILFAEKGASLRMPSHVHVKDISRRMIPLDMARKWKRVMCLVLSHKGYSQKCLLRSSP